MKPSAISSVLPVLVKSRRPVMIWGGAGVGKSSIVKQYAAAHRLELRDVRLSQLDSIDLRGFPMPDAKRGNTTWLPADFLPTPKDAPGILFLDELNGALPATAAAAYQLILDFKIGNYTLPDNWNIIAAGNRQSDRGATHQLPAPLNNRFIHIDFDIDPEDWQNRAMDDGVHPHIRAYLKLRPQALHIFDSKDNPRSFPTPRSWYFVDEIYKMEDVSRLAKFELISGTIGEAASAELIGFVKDLDAMPDMEDVVKNPTTAKLPGNAAVMHAVAMTLVDMTTPKIFDTLMKYVTRLPIEIQVVFMRGALQRSAATRNTKAFTDWAVKNSKILM